MKRVWIGMGIGAVLIAAAVFSLLYTIHTVGAIETELQEAMTASREGNWPEATEKTETAMTLWQQSRPILNVFHPHDPLELIESSFEALHAFAAHKDREFFQVRNGELQRRMACIRDCDLPVVGNIL